MNKIVKRSKMVKMELKVVKIIKIEVLWLKWSFVVAAIQYQLTFLSSTAPSPLI